jgi:putative SOS response-associated peptidase YedK
MAISLPEEPLLRWPACGMVERPSAGGVETYTIVTTAANQMLAPLHDRMPVIVAERDYERWLEPEDEARNLLVPFADEAIRITKS